MSSPDCHYIIIFMTLCLSDVLYIHTPCADVPFIPSNVVRAVRKVKRWWGVAVVVGAGPLAGWLYIPRSKQDEIRRNFPDEMEQKRQAISYWINTDPLASWRRLITALDRMRETKVADSIRSNAEPLTGIVTMTTTACSHVPLHTLYIMPHITLCALYTALVILTLSEYQYRLYVGMAYRHVYLVIHFKSGNSSVETTYR